MASADKFTTPNEESLGCLFLVTAFAEVAHALEPVVADAAARIMMSPTLGDFIELRFVDLGPRPGDGAGLTTVVSRIADELTHPGNDPGQNYFALVIADHSAAVIDQIWHACRGSDVISALPIRCRGLAVNDDRRAERETATMPGAAADVMVASCGGWRRRELIDELRRYADELLRGSAAGRVRGLTRAELASLRTSSEEIVPFRPSPAPRDIDVLRDNTVTALHEKGRRIVQ
jgi:hypothetical protein